MAAKDSFFTEFVDKPYRGNMNTTIIRTNKGKTMMLQHDVSTPRPYSRIHLLSGTKGWLKNGPVRNELLLVIAGQNRRTEKTI